MAVIFAIPCLVDAVMILILWGLGSTTTALAANFAGLLCYFLLGCAAIAIGEFLSGLTENQIIAAVMGVAVLLLAYMMPSLRTMFNAGSAVALAVLPGWRERPPCWWGCAPGALHWDVCCSRPSAWGCPASSS